MGDRIRELRKTLGLTQQEFSTRIHISQSALANYESGARQPLDAVIGAITREFNVSEDWLRTGSGKMFIPNKDDLIEAAAQRHHLDTFSTEFVRQFMELGYEERKTIRLFLQKVVAAAEAKGAGEVPADVIRPTPPRVLIYLGKIAAAGTAIDSFDMLLNGTMTVEDTEEAQRADYAIGVSGDSMAPMYEDGDVLLVEKAEDHELEVGEIGIFQHENTVYVKRLGVGCLESINAHYGPIAAPGGVRCLGRVIGKAVVR